MVTPRTLGDAPPEVADEEMYDGPMPNVVAMDRRPLFAPSQPAEPQPPRELRLGYMPMINAALDVLSARLLGLVAVVGAVAMFGYAVVSPDPWRTYTAAAYAVLGLCPVIWLYLRRG